MSYGPRAFERLCLLNCLVDIGPATIALVNKVRVGYPVGHRSGSLLLLWIIALFGIYGTARVVNMRSIDSRIRFVVSLIVSSLCVFVSYYLVQLPYFLQS
jgi:hypothetical protein